MRSHPEEGNKESVLKWLCVFIYLFINYVCNTVMYVYCILYSYVCRLRIPSLPDD
jgi:hypothetical protein